MAEHIEREKAYEMLNALGGCGAEPESWADGWDKAIDTAIDELNKIPAADVRPEIHGRWTRHPFNTTKCSYLWQCSECNGIAYWVSNGGKLNKVKPIGYKYCPNCGAKMDGKDTDK